MTIGAIIQARMSSRRLPGKVLLPLAGKPVLQYVVEAAGRVPDLAGVVVATSNEASDDPIANFCAENKIHCFRGSLEDVARRFMAALGKYGWDGAVRISADSPLLDWHLIEEAVQHFQTNAWDLVTNVWPRSYPHGQSVEVVRAAALISAYKKFSQADDFEHVTQYFYRHEHEWRIKAIVAKRDLSHVQMALDTPEDLARLEQLVRQQV